MRTERLLLIAVLSIVAAVLVPRLPAHSAIATIVEVLLAGTLLTLAFLDPLARLVWEIRAWRARRQLGLAITPMPSELPSPASIPFRVCVTPQHEIHLSSLRVCLAFENSARSFHGDRVSFFQSVAEECVVEQIRLEPGVPKEWQGTLTRPIDETSPTSRRWFLLAAATSSTKDAPTVARRRVRL